MQSVRERANDFDDFTQISQHVQSTLNDADRLILDEKYTLLKDRYNRLLDSLTQRVSLLDQAYRKYQLSEEEFTYSKISP